MQRIFLQLLYDLQQVLEEENLDFAALHGYLSLLRKEVGLLVAETENGEFTLGWIAVAQVLDSA